MTVELPRMLAELIGGTRTVEVEATTVGEALEATFAAHPALRVHLLDERGDLRRHVVCFHDGASVADLGRPLDRPGTVTVVQAVSGG